MWQDFRNELRLHHISVALNVTHFSTKCICMFSCCVHGHKLCRLTPRSLSFLGYTVTKRQIVVVFTSRELLCFVCAHKLAIMCLLSEMYKMNRHPSTRAVHYTLQIKLHVVLGVHSKGVGRHRSSITCTVIGADFL